jgi:hypothetical protein
MKQLAKDCVVNILQFKSDKKDTKIELLQCKLDRKDTLLENKDKLIDDLHKEIEKLRQIVMPVPQPMYDERQTCEPMVSVGQIPGQSQEQPANQTEEATLDLFYQSFT